jgi:hypothetical protein
MKQIAELPAWAHPITSEREAQAQGSLAHQMKAVRKAAGRFPPTLMGVSVVPSPALLPYRPRRKAAIVPGMVRNRRDRLRAVAPVDLENRDTAE